MMERLSSFGILLGTVLVVLALWYLSYRVVRWDTHRQGMRPIQRKAWIAAAIILPVFGGALYLAVQVLQHYLTPPPEEKTANGDRDIVIPSMGLSRVMEYPVSEQAYRNSDDILRQAFVPEPAWGGTEPARSNGKAQTHAPLETVRAPYQALQTRYSLVVIEGPLQGQQFLILSLPLRIGRGEEAGIALDADLNVSRKHAELYEWNGRLRIRDLESLHGLEVNGATTNDQALSPGDRITLGSTVLILRELP